MHTIVARGGGGDDAGGHAGQRTTPSPPPPTHALRDWAWPVAAAVAAGGLGGGVWSGGARMLRGLTGRGAEGKGRGRWLRLPGSAANPGHGPGWQKCNKFQSGYDSSVHTRIYRIIPAIVSPHQSSPPASAAMKCSPSDSGGSAARPRRALAHRGQTLDGRGRRSHSGAPMR